MEVKLGKEVVILPSGFEKIPDNFKRKEVQQYIEENSLVRRVVKHFSTEVQRVVLFNPENENFLALLERYKANDRCLGDAIQKIIDEEQLPIWTRKNSQPNSKKQHQRVRFMLRPVFTASSRPEKAQNTPDWGYRRDLFILHFDDELNLQMVRFWDHKRMPSLISKRRTQVHEELLQTKELLKEKYGDWKSMAEILFRIIQNVYTEE